MVGDRCLGGRRGECCLALRRASTLLCSGQGHAGMLTSLYVAVVYLNCKFEL